MTGRKQVPALATDALVVHPARRGRAQVPVRNASVRPRRQAVEQGVAAAPVRPAPPMPGVDAPVGPLPPPAGWARPNVLTSCTEALGALSGRTLETIGVSSCAAGEGRTTIACGLAVVERCTYGRRTILAEFDLHKPSLSQRLGLPTSPGLADVLWGEATIDECVQWPFAHLGVLVAGDVADYRPELADRLVSSKVVTELGQHCDALVVDLPPLRPDGLGARVAELCSTVVLVVRAGSTSPAQIRQAAATLETPPAVILNRRKPIGPAWMDSMLRGER